QEWIISEEIIEESGELEGFDYIRGKIFGRAIAVYGWMDSCLTGDAAEAIYYQMPLSIKDNAEHTGAQMRGFRGFVCTKYRQYDTEKHDYEYMISINLKEGVIDDHNLLCPKQ
ncbi:MAG: hypothetical protein LBF93_01310, partial [Zoogloeaceae bacterium]|nr:hypothetical protein [Zoogloeaceae bacterium]